VPTAAELQACAGRIRERAACAKEYCAMATDASVAHLASVLPPGQATQMKPRLLQNCLQSMQQQSQDDASRRQACEKIAEAGGLRRMLAAMDRCQAKRSCAAKVACLRPLLIDAEPPKP